MKTSRSISTLVLLPLIAIGSLSACGDGELASSGGPSNPDAAYALGLITARTVAQFRFSDAERAEFERGMRDYDSGKPRVSLLGELPRIQAFQLERMNAAVEYERVSGEEFLKSAAAEAGAEQLPSGIVIQTLAAGEGKTPEPKDRVVLHAEGTLPDGTVFLSSEQSSKPLAVEMATGIPCLTEPLARLAVGARAKITCPPQAGYSERDRPPLIPPGAALRFEIEVVDAKPSAADFHR